MAVVFSEEESKRRYFFCVREKNFRFPVKFFRFCLGCEGSSVVFQVQFVPPDRKRFEICLLNLFQILRKLAVLDLRENTLFLVSSCSVEHLSVRASSMISQPVKNEDIFLSRVFFKLSQAICHSFSI